MFKILIPVDFSPSSDNACRYAIHLAAAHPQAEIMLLHCFRDYLLEPELNDPFANTGITPLSPGSEEITDRVLHRNQTDEHKQLEELCTTLQAQAPGQQVQLKSAFANGLPEDTIPEQINKYKPDLLVMGTKAEDDWVRSLFGTITTKMVDDATVPLLTVPEPYMRHGIGRVLYATDFNHTDVQAIANLQQLLQPFNTSIACVHISSEGTPEKDKQQLTQLQNELQASINSRHIQFIHLEGDDVADTLEEFIKREQVQLIAVNNQQRSLFSSLLHPSLTKKLVLEVQVPLLVFHSPAKS